MFMEVHRCYRFRGFEGRAFARQTKLVRGIDQKTGRAKSPDRNDVMNNMAEISQARLPWTVRVVGNPCH